MTSLWTRFQFGNLCASLKHPVSNSMNTSGSFTRDKKRPGLEADHSPPTSDEMKNEWSYASTTPTHLHGVYRDNFSCSKLMYYHHWRFKRYTDIFHGICLLMAAARRPYSFRLTCSATHFIVMWRSLPLRCENGNHTFVSTSGACNSSFVRGCFWILEQYCTWSFRDYQVQHTEFEGTC